MSTALSSLILLFGFPYVDSRGDTLPPQVLREVNRENVSELPIRLVVECKGIEGCPIGFRIRTTSRDIGRVEGTADLVLSAKDRFLGQVRLEATQIDGGSEWRFELAPEVADESVDRQALLLLVSSSSLLPILTRAQDVRALPKRLTALVAARLRKLGIDGWLIEAELAAMDPVYVAATLDRSVLGSMVDFAKAIPHYLPVGGWDETSLPSVESRLAETPCRVSGPMEATLFPDRAAPELLMARWCAV